MINGRILRLRVYIVEVWLVREVVPNVTSEKNDK